MFSFQSFNKICHELVVNSTHTPLKRLNSTVESCQWCILGISGWLVCSKNAKLTRKTRSTQPPPHQADNHHDANDGKIMQRYKLIWCKVQMCHCIDMINWLSVLQAVNELTNWTNKHDRSQYLLAVLMKQQNKNRKCWVQGVESVTSDRWRLTKCKI